MKKNEYSCKYNPINRLRCTTRWRSGGGGGGGDGGGGDGGGGGGGVGCGHRCR